jgi:dipeptidyl aminopeptidase/acylaminoacyl peptidase
MLVYITCFRKQNQMKRKQTYIGMRHQAGAPIKGHLARACAAALLWVSLMSTSSVAQARRLSLDDVLNFNQVTDVELSPDGNRIACLITCPGSNDAYGTLGEYSTLHILDLRTRETIELTDGGFKIRDGLQAPATGEGETGFIVRGIQMPRWSPDGQTVAFISRRGSSPQVWLVDTRGSGPRQLTGRSSEAGVAQSSVEEFAFSPDGRSIAFVATITPRGDERSPDMLKVVAVSGESSVLKGTDDSQRTVIDVIDIATGKGERLIEGETRASSLRWSPDGSQLLFLPRPVFSLYAFKEDISLLSIKGKKVTVPARTHAIEYIPDLSPDGAEVAFLATVVTDPWNRFPNQNWNPIRVVEVMSTRTGAIRRISGDYTNGWNFLPLVWHKATNTIYFGGRDKATTRIFALSPTGDALRRVTPEDLHVRDYSLSGDGKRMAAILEDANTPPEIYVGNPNTGDFTRLTKLNPQLDQIRLGRVDKIKWRSRDGRFTVEGFLVKPPDYRPGKKYPLLVNLHGGPGSLYQNGFIDVNFLSGYHTPAQLYAAAGYMVLLPNKRGDPSYGPEFVRAHMRDWGRGDVNNDTEAGVDLLIDQGLADPERLGIMGFSYGGYAATWAVTQTKRYKAASVNDGMINLISYYGQAYLYNHTFLEYYMGGNPTEQQALYVDRSPITWAGRITTPMLLRYPTGRGHIRPQGLIGLAQGRELYRALHERGVPVELLIHPQEGHVIRDLEVYRDYVQRNLRWFDYWVLGKGTNPLKSEKE